MKPIRRILLDLDDTLNSFTLYVLNRMGAPVQPFDYDKYPVECGYNIVEAYKTLTGLSVSEEWFWGMIHEGYWANAPRSPEFRRLIEESIARVGVGNVGLLTRAIDCPKCWAGKYQWCREFLPVSMKRQFSMTQNKTLSASPGVLLIDDSERYCEAFQKAGGEAILVPRPWNKKVGCDTWGTIETDLEDYIYENS